QQYPADHSRHDGSSEVSEVLAPLSLVQTSELWCDGRRRPREFLRRHSRMPGGDAVRGWLQPFGKTLLHHGAVPEPGVSESRAVRSGDVDLHRLPPGWIDEPAAGAWAWLRQRLQQTQHLVRLTTKEPFHRRYGHESDKAGDAYQRNR